MKRVLQIETAFILTSGIWVPPAMMRLITWGYPFPPWNMFWKVWLAEFIGITLFAVFFWGVWRRLFLRNQ